MANKSREEKNKRISKTRSATKERRKSQRPVTLCCKFRNEKRNKEAKQHFKKAFIECKWIYNSILNQIDKTKENFKSINDFSQKDFKTVVHLDKDKKEVTDEVKCASSSMRDGVIDKVKYNMSSLKKKKEKGENKTSKLKFKSDYDTIFLKQYGNTHRIIDYNRIQIQGYKEDIRVGGLQQLKKLDELGIKYELASAELILVGSDVYFHQTIYIDNDEYKRYLALTNKTKKKYRQTGLDFGCSTTLVDSNGCTENVYVEESEQIKKLQKQLKRKVKYSNNWYKTRNKLRIAYQHLTFKKDDTAKKIYHRLITESEQIIMQDEQISSWQKMGHGKKVQHSILGRLKQLLVKNSELVKVMSKWVPTTKLCRDCGKLHKDIELSEREFVCPHCGVVYDRDIHAAENMVWVFNHLNEHIGMDGTDFKRSDFLDALEKLFSNVSTEDSISESGQEKITNEAPGSLVQ